MPSSERIAPLASETATIQQPICCIATRIAAGTGQLLAFVFGFVGLLYNPLLIFIARPRR